ncbi:MAG: hypothetical protein DMF90_25945, partial [Acidobacteria bacterium]
MIDLQQPAIAKRVHEFFLEEGISLGLIAHQTRHLVADLADPQLLTNERPRFVWRQRVEPHHESVVGHIQSDELGAFSAWLTGRMTNRTSTSGTPRTTASA